MKIEKISSIQLLFLIIGQVQGGTLIASFATGTAKHDIWIALIAGFVISLSWVWIYGTLLQKFSGKNLVQIHTVIYGPYMGNTISILYIFFFFSIVALLVRVVGGFINTYLLPETPTVAILSVFVLLSAWVLRYGLEVVARCNIVFVVIAMAIAAFTVVLLIKDMKLTNFLPVFEVSVKDFLKATHIIAAGSFQIVVFLMIAPCINKLKEVKKVMFFGLLLGMITLVILEVRNTAVLGALEPLMTFASYRAVRLVNIGDILTRLEVLVSVGLLLSIFVRICMSYYATVLAATQLLGLKSYSFLVFPVGIIIVNISMVAFDSSAEQAVFDMQVMPFYFFLFEFIFPLISLTILLFRERQGGKRR